VFILLPHVAEMGFGGGRRRGSWEMLNRDELNVVRIQLGQIQATQSGSLDSPKIPARAPGRQTRKGKARRATKESSSGVTGFLRVG
jgi:hypothetical protein